MKKGDRVRLSPKGKQQGVASKKNRESAGTIVGGSRDGTCWRIRWDGSTSRYPSDAIHESFLELI
jgi:hypothetical protein